VYVFFDLNDLERLKSLKLFGSDSFSCCRLHSPLDMSTCCLLLYAIQTCFPILPDIKFSGVWRIRPVAVHHNFLVAEMAKHISYGPFVDSLSLRTPFDEESETLKPMCTPYLRMSRGPYRHHELRTFEHCIQNTASGYMSKPYSPHTTHAIHWVYKLRELPGNCRPKRPAKYNVHTHTHTTKFPVRPPLFY
jgi:hypothetical protein